MSINQIEAFRETVRRAADHGMPEKPGDELGLDHLRTMLERVSSEDFSDAKLGRWLGWAQCAVVAAGIGITLEDMKILNTRHAGHKIVERMPPSPDPDLLDLADRLDDAIEETTLAAEFGNPPSVEAARVLVSGAELVRGLVVDLAAVTAQAQGGA